MIIRLLKKILTTSITLLTLVFLSLITYLTINNVRTERLPEQQAFLTGTAEAPSPGTYRGTSDLPLNSWRGKIISPDPQSGTNVFSSNGYAQKKFPFQITQAQGIRNPEQTVIRLDYNTQPNPWYIRTLIIEELVKNDANQYLGKTQLRVLPGLAFTLGFFTLESTDS